MRCRDADDGHVERVVAQTGAGKIDRGHETGLGRAEVDRPNRGHSRTADGVVEIEARAQRVQPPQDLRVTAQEPGHQQRQHRDNCGFDDEYRRRHAVPPSTTPVFMAVVSSAIAPSVSVVSCTQHATRAKKIAPSNQ